MRQQEGTSDRSPHRWPAFAALGHRNYLLLWIGNLISNTGDWMDQVALNWLVWTLTHNPVDLATLNACRALPILVFTLFGGALADHVERRRLMQLTQVFAMALAFILAILVWASVVQLWQVFFIGILRGVTMSVLQPTRGALVSELVPREILMNAVALNTATLNMSRVLGGMLGGVLIGLVGVTGCFLFNGFSFVVVIWALALMRLPIRQGTRQHKGLAHSVLEGLRYIRGEPALLGLMLAGLAPMVFGMPYMSLLPIFADSVLQISNEGYGLMVAFSGIGALTGALMVASLTNFRRRGQLMLAVMAAFGLALLLFSMSSWTPLSLALLLGVGGGSTGYVAITASLLQTHASDEMRGRVMSVFLLNRGLVPLGTMLAGLAAQLVGAPLTIAMMGVIVMVLALIIARRIPVLHQLG